MKRTLIGTLACGWMALSLVPVHLRAQPASEFQNPEYIQVSQRRLLTIIVTNSVTANQNYDTTIIERIPRPVPWRDGKTYEGLTNLSFTPSPPGGIWLKPGVNDVSKKITATQTWQCNPQPACQWEWHFHGLAGQTIVTTSKYQIVTAWRRLRTEKFHLTLAEFDELPPDLKTAVDQLKASLPANVVALSKTIAGNEDDPVKIIRKINGWCTKNVPQQANDLSGHYITRYNIQIPINEKRGWCGPRSSTFRALCAVYGIPAREVSGYCLKKSFNYSGGEINSMAGRTHRPNDSNAHVWAEVFLPKAGWVEVEIDADNPFAVSDTYVPVYGIEAPTIEVKDEKGNWIPSEASQNITVSSEEMLP
ncbi:MAG TPA: transglutaminase-like domain-containing protein [Verrucomicrobiae bacterium]|jgi:transglutaminase-like putative cysteine protease